MRENFVLLHGRKIALFLAAAAAMFKATAQDGLARCGMMVIKNTTINTPATMLYTRRGGCLYLTPDMMEKLRPEAQLVQINTMQFMQMPSPEIIKTFGRSIHHYLGIPEWPIFASNRDPTMAEYFSTKPSNNTAAYVTVYTGGTYVTPERYMQAIAALQPDMFVAIADEVPGDARPKRVTQSVDRTIKWLDECIQHHNSTAQPQQQQQEGQQEQQQQQQQQQPQQQQPDANQGTNGTNSSCASSSPSAATQLFAPVVGAASEAERQRSAKAAAERDVAGFALCGFGTGEPASARPGLIAAAVQHLPADKPRLASGLACPEEILEAVLQGVDLFDCSYPTHATSNGYALCFPLRQPDGSAAAAAAADGADAAAAAGDGFDPDLGADDTKVNLWSTQYKMDKGPLVAGCSCFTCKNHSRAYIHHLLQTHEMLATVLLEMHNTHWWLAFFEAIQEAIQQGRLQQYVVWFKQRREDMQNAQLMDNMEQ